MDKNIEFIATLHEWCLRNKLTINFDKTKHMLVPRNDVCEQLVCSKKIILGGSTLENVSVYHYLGIDLDKHMTFDKLVDATFNKANQKLHLLKKIRPFISISVAAQVYKSHVLPILDYGDFLVDSCTQNKINTLDSIQNRAVRIIDNKVNFGKKYDQLLDIYDLQPLNQRRKEHQN